MTPKCAQCGLADSGCQSPKMKPAGDGRRKILVVGEYPGPAEDGAGEPLVGGVGRYVASEFRRVGLDLKRDCVATNAQICYSPSGGTHATAVDDCRPNLLKTITAVDPHVIVLLGTRALQSVVGHMWKSDCGAIGKWVGWAIPGRKPNAWICPMHNPAAFMSDRDEVQSRQFARHVAAVAALRGRPWPDGIPDEKSAVTPLADVDAAARLAKIRSGTVAFDFESNMLGPDHTASEIVCCAVATGPDAAFAFMWRGEARKEMARLLEDPEVSKIGANCQFEHRWCLAKVGVRVRGWVWDVVLSAHALDPRGGISSVKFQSFVRLGAPDYNHHVEPFLGTTTPGKYAMNKIHQVSPELILAYCGADALLEYKIAVHQAAEMGAEI